MTIGTSVQTILNILRGTMLFAGINQKLDAIQAKLNELQADLEELKIQLSVPETGSFNPNPEDPTMSVLQMTVGDPPFGPKVLTFSEPGAPADGAVQSDNPAVATISLDPTDHASWTITLTPGAPPITGPVTVNMTYTGTSDPPDAGPVVVEPLVLTVVPTPTAETGQFNP